MTRNTDAGPYGYRVRNEYDSNHLTRNDWRASLVNDVGEGYVRSRRSTMMKLPHRMNRKTRTPYVPELTPEIGGPPVDFLLGARVGTRVRKRPGGSRNQRRGDPVSKFLDARRTVGRTVFPPRSPRPVPEDYANAPSRPPKDVGRATYNGTSWPQRLGGGDTTWYEGGPRGLISWRAGVATGRRNVRKGVGPVRVSRA